MYSYLLDGFLFEVFLSIAIMNTAVNRYFGGLLGGVGNNLNTVIVYVFFYAGIRFFKS